MPPTVTPGQIALRLALAAVASAAVGVNRERGHTAGLRTTLLVGLAAALSMVLANVMLDTAGRTPSSFVQLDLMRLPLGVLSGMGFIGAGAVLRRGDQVRGLTTAATLWFVTVMGLCFGGGRLALGAASGAAALPILWGLKRVEHHLPEPRQATLVVTARADGGPTDADVRRALAAAGFAGVASGVTVSPAAGRRRTTWAVTWRAPADATADATADPRPCLDALAVHPGTVRLQWQA